MEIRIAQPDADGIGEVAVRSKTVMSHYLDDPEMTAETIVDGWLMTGDLGRIDSTGHLQLFGPQEKHDRHRRGEKYLSRGYRECISRDIAVKEFCVFAANYIWPQHTMTGEQLVLVLHPEPGQTVNDALLKEISRRNAQLLNYKRISGYIVWDQDFPRTAAMKIKRVVLAGADWQATRPRRDGSPVNERYFTIVNPAAGGGRCGKLAPARARQTARGWPAAGGARNARARRSHRARP